MTTLHGDSIDDRPFPHRGNTLLEVFFIILIIIGVMLRLITFHSYDFEHGVIFYAAMADAIVRHGSLTMPLGQVFSDSTQRAPSHHFSPLYPMYLAAWFFFMPYSPFVVHLASVVLSLLFLTVWCLCVTRLYGRRLALISTGLWSLNGIVLDITGKCLSENLILLLMTLTLGFAVQALRQTRRRYWCLSGLFAGLTFLSKAKAGLAWFFILLLAVTALWFLRRQYTVKVRHIFCAAAPFVLLSGSWLVRNYLLFGTTATSSHNATAYAYALAHPQLWFWGVMGYLPWFASVLLFHVLPFLPLIRRHILRAPLLSILLFLGSLSLWGASLLITGAVWTYEGGFYLMNSLRYIIPSIVPFAFAVLELCRAPSLLQAPNRPLIIKAVGSSTLAMLLSGLVVICWSIWFPLKQHVSSKEIKMGEVLVTQVKQGDCVQIMPAIHKNLLLYYYLRCKDKEGVEFINGPHARSKSGKDCEFLLHYKEEGTNQSLNNGLEYAEQMSLRGYKKIYSAFNRVDLWKRIPQ